MSGVLDSCRLLSSGSIASKKGGAMPTGAAGTPCLPALNGGGRVRRPLTHGRVVPLVGSSAASVEAPA